MVIDLDVVENAAQLHELLATKLGFPDFYGRNWDSFWDCIRDPDMSAVPASLVLTGWSAFEAKMPRDARIMREVLTDFMQERPECTVEWA